MRRHGETWAEDMVKHEPHTNFLFFYAFAGLSVAVVEKFDFSSGTSSKSTKLIHGGVRYLQKAVFNLDYAQVMLP